MDQTYDDEDIVKRAFDAINQLKAKSIKDSEEAVEYSGSEIDVNAVGLEACGMKTSSNVDTPVLGHEGSQTDSGDI